MSQENPFYVDIPTPECFTDDPNAAWKNIAEFATRAEAVAFVREHVDITADEHGRVSLICGGEADEQAPDASPHAQALVDALQWITRCAKMRGPCGATVYFIADERMEAAREALRLAGVQWNEPWSQTSEGRRERIAAQ